MTAESDDYENRVADLLRAVLPKECVIAGGEYLEGDLTGKHRQIEVLVRGPLFGLAGGVMVVECRSHARPVDATIVVAGGSGDVRLTGGFRPGWLCHVRELMGYSV
jgi:hypothetical protein